VRKSLRCPVCEVYYTLSRCNMSAFGMLSLLLLADYFVVSLPPSALGTRTDASGSISPVPTNDANMPLSIAGLPAARYTITAVAVSQGVG
jgi:hypothetical protein